MSNKKKTLKRQVKTPAQYSDYVVGNMSKKRNDVISVKGSDWCISITKISPSKAFS